MAKKKTNKNIPPAYPHPYLRRAAVCHVFEPLYAGAGDMGRFRHGYGGQL